MTRATGRNSFRNLISRNKSLLFLVAIAITANVEEWNVIPDSSPISSLVGFAEAFAAGGFGGGGGGGGGFGSAKGKAGTKKSKKKKKRQSLVEITEASTTATKKNVGTANTPTPDTNQPKLDKWGLPVAALEDIFPPLPESTKLDPVDSSKDHYELSEIQNLLKDHVDLGDLNRIFDDQGVAKIPNEDGSTMRLRVLHESPPVLALDNFLTRDECQDVKRVAENEMSTHRVDSATFKGALSTRTSTSWFCQYSAVPMLVAKAHYILGVPLETMEEPQIVRYKGGEEFSWHYDEVPSPQLSNGGQRVATLLVYLTTVPSSRGGGTTFRDLKESSSSSSSLVMQPERGSALLFFPSFADGTPDDRTLHKSEILVGNNNNNNNNENENVSDPAIGGKRRPRWIESEADLLERCETTLNGLLENHTDTGASLCIVSHAPCDQAMAFSMEAGAATPAESELTPWPLGGITVFSRPIVRSGGDGDDGDDNDNGDGDDNDNDNEIEYGEWTMDLYGNTEHMPGDYKAGLKEWSLPCFCK